jgi:hypothetical protein
MSRGPRIQLNPSTKDPMTSTARGSCFASFGTLGAGNLHSRHLLLEFGHLALVSGRVDCPTGQLNDSAHYTSYTMHPDLGTPFEVIMCPRESAMFSSCFGVAIDESLLRFESSPDKHTRAVCQSLCSGLRKKSANTLSITFA